MRGQPNISRIYQMANDSPPVGQEAEQRNDAARAALWKRMGLVVLDPSDINNEWLRQAITNEAEARYGRRGKNG